ncbi:ParB N-terminal domain-containing protein [Persicobacter diffluens]|uniref:ParB N-terminal domain-containing protein n=1 Tax=Persicobacter diffluens TaxID=981 RepID=UPI0030C6EF71
MSASFHKGDEVAPGQTGRWIIGERELVIRPQLKLFIIPLSEEERAQLRASIQEEGVRDSLVLWKNGGEYVLIDGHNRFAVIQELGLMDFPYITKAFASEGEVTHWMIQNQMARRNLNPKASKYYRGMLFNKSKRNRDENLKQYTEVQNLHFGENRDTAAEIAKTTGVSRRTILSDAKYQEGLDKLEEATKLKILTGRIKVADRKILDLADDKISAEEIFKGDEPGEKKAPVTEFDKRIKHVVKYLHALMKDQKLNVRQKAHLLKMINEL